MERRESPNNCVGNGESLFLDSNSRCPCSDGRALGYRWLWFASVGGSGKDSESNQRV